MPKKNLNDPYIKNFKAPDKRIEIYDEHTSGLALRVSPTNHKSFVFRYRIGNKVKRFTIGSYPHVSLSKARSKAKELSYKISNGIDPLKEKQKKKFQPAELTFSEIAEEFKRKHFETLRKSTKDEYERIIDNELKPALGEHSISNIQKGQIRKLLDKKAFQDDSPTMANRIRARLSKIYSFAIEREYVENNPIRNIPKFSHGERKRDRYYSDEEVKKLWQAFESLGEPSQSILKLLLLLGQRKRETCRMRWSDIQDGIWKIPAKDAKNGRSHEVPLSSVAIGIISEAKCRTGEKTYVFESPVVSNQPIKELKRSVEKVRDISTIKDFRLHDLRRTVITNMSKLGIDRTVAGKIVNHRGLAGDNHITAIYDRHQYSKEKKKALEIWSRQLTGIIEKTESNIKTENGSEG